MKSIFLHFDAVFGVPGDPIIPPEILFCLTGYVVICRPKLLSETENRQPGTKTRVFVPGFRDKKKSFCPWLSVFSLTQQFWSTYYYISNRAEKDFRWDNWIYRQYSVPTSLVLSEYYCSPNSNVWRENWCNCSKMFDPGFMQN